ncbi:hypothetical protein L1987_88844 [Smallanthus sonchifolius]|nr:hypothetical protein L1987_89139 [Smallanthus sonchifolius]KAI3666634.1 hypothetical protein L1987_88844 [Smallanthus sonchifolius]
MGPCCSQVKALNGSRSRKFIVFLDSNQKELLSLLKPCLSFEAGLKLSKSGPQDFGYLTPTRAHRGRQDSAPSYRNKTEAELRNSFSGTAISLTFETDSTQPEGTDSLRSETLEMP